PRAALLRHAQLFPLVPAPHAAPAAPRAILSNFSLVAAPCAGMSAPRAGRLRVL
ncbi:hypothetical protein A2U01_0107633, partial [Trifolium medium]|nr:hypothetical protein [Trifolium medium]